MAAWFLATDDLYPSQQLDQNLTLVKFMLPWIRRCSSCDFTLVCAKSSQICKIIVMVEPWSVLLMFGSAMTDCSAAGFSNAHYWRTLC